MNGFEVIEVDVSAVVVTVAFNSTLEGTIIAKKRATNKSDSIGTIRTIN